MTTIGIYRLTREWSTYGWLCARHVEVRRFARWSLERIGDVDGGCQDCEFEAQADPAYRTPTPEFVPTNPACVHIPQPTEKPRKRGIAPARPKRRQLEAR